MTHPEDKAENDRLLNERPIVMGGMLAPGFCIGKFILRDSYGGERDKISIETEGGEGGDFSVAELEKLIETFYAKNF